MPLVSSECIAEGAMVDTPDGLRAIETLIEGDALVSMDPSTGQRFKTTTLRVHVTRRECVALRFGRTTLRCTPRQPIYDPKEGVFAPASEWIEGRREALLDVDLRRVLVDTVLLDGGGAPAAQLHRRRCAGAQRDDGGPDGAGAVALPRWRVTASNTNSGSTASSTTSRRTCPSR